MKRWFLDLFLPMWAKETVLRENRALKSKLRALEGENKELKAYCKGLELGMRTIRRLRWEE